MFTFSSKMYQNRVKRLLLPTLIMLALVSPGSQAQDATQTHEISSILLVAEQWQDYTNADGSGVYWELIKAVYQHAGIEVRFKLYPWIRANRMIINKRADAIVGDYYDPQQAGKNFLFPQWHLSIEDPIIMVNKALYLQADALWPSDKKKLIGFIRGYGFEHKTWFVPPFQKYEVNDLAHGLRMLAADRLYGVADYASNLIPLIPDNDSNPQHRYQLTQLEAGQQLYLKFANTKRAQQLIKVYDRRIKEMMENGEIEKILRNWKLPKSKFYPIATDKTE